MRIVRRVILIAVLAAALTGSVAFIAAVSERLPSRSITRFIPKNEAFVALYSRQALFSIADSTQLPWAMLKKRSWQELESTAQTRISEIAYFTTGAGNGVIIQFSGEPFVSTAIQDVDLSQTDIGFIQAGGLFIDLGRHVYAALEHIERNQLANDNPIFSDVESGVHLGMFGESDAPSYITDVLTNPRYGIVHVTDERSLVRIEYTSLEQDVSDQEAYIATGMNGMTVFVGKGVDSELYQQFGGSLLSQITSDYLLSPEVTVDILKKASGSAANEKSFLLYFVDLDSAREAINRLGSALGEEDRISSLPDGSSYREIIRSLPEARLLIHNGLEVIRWTNRTEDRYLYLLEREGVSYLTNSIDRIEQIGQPTASVTSAIRSCARETDYPLLSAVYSHNYTQPGHAGLQQEFTYVKQKKSNIETIYTSCIAKIP